MECEPHVALHFVTAAMACYSLDGMVWCVDRQRVHDWLPEPLRAILHEEEADVFTAEMLERGAPTLKQFDTLASAEFASFFEPPSMGDRVVNQFTLFSPSFRSCPPLAPGWIAGWSGTQWSAGAVVFPPCSNGRFATGWMKSTSRSVSSSLVWMG